MLDKTMAALGAALLAATLSCAAWLAFRSQPAPEGPPTAANDNWEVSAELRERMLADLPAVFERRAREARAHGLRVPPPSAFTIEFRPRWLGKRRLVSFVDRCDSEDQIRAADPAVPADDASLPPQEQPRFACLLSGVYDPEQQRYVQASFGWFQPPYRTPELDCGTRPFKAVTRLADLPEDILVALDGPADRSEPFQATDAIRPGGGNSRRFSLAAIDDDLAIVAVEHGGIVYNVETWLFEKRQGHWDGEVRWLGDRPNSLQALLHDACAGVPRPPTRDFDKGELVVAWPESNGDLLLVMTDEPSMDFVLHPRLGRRDEVFGANKRDRVLSRQERHDLRDHLLARRSEILPDWPAYDAITRFVAALSDDS